MLHIQSIAALLLLVSAYGSTGTDETCPADPWEAALEDWATAERGNLTRHGRIMSLPASQGYYVSDRIDLVPPPPPHAHMHHRGPYPAAPHHPPHHGPSPPGQGPPGHSYDQGGQPSHGPTLGGSYQPQSQSGPNHGPSSYQPQSQSGQSHDPSSYQAQSQSGQSHDPSSYQAQSQSGQSHDPSSYRPQPPAGPPPGPPGPGSMPYDEWQATPPPPPGAGKIVNRPPNPYKDQFKPSYAPPSTRPIPLNDRVDSGAGPPAPQKAVSETDLYLLRAIEKLVYRVDLMEKRMRKMEENLHYIVAGVEAKPEACAANFTRVGAGCYHFSSEAVNWKSASYACRKIKANLLELDGDEKRQFSTGVLADRTLKGADFWTGGLNPGLLWIWSHSAKPVSSNSTDSSGIVGEGRCLALVHDPATQTYLYRGQDCALRHRYVCERDDDNKLGNEIERVAKSLRETNRKPKIALDRL